MPPLSNFDITTRLEYAVDASSSSHSTFQVKESYRKGPLQRSQGTPSIVRPSDKIRRVSFQTTAKVYTIEAVDDYSEEERIATWLTQDEMKQMKQERKVTVKIMEKLNCLIDDEQHYYRGLEFKTKEGFRRKQWNIIEAAMVVFDEQIDVIQHSQNDGRSSHCSAEVDEGISEAYKSCTMGPLAAAIERARHDRKAAESSLSLSETQETKQTQRRLSPSAA
mmetsp:Transcript_19217/g.41766  ORF Transcript_19217/g.41766 Transcript_19217/m.41766 type:complete len:221 (-) Transcript_19217:148-810(-)